MLRLKCVKEVKHGLFGRYGVGQIVQASEKHGHSLLKRLPGHFTVTPDQPELQEETTPAAMSTETEGALVPSKQAKPRSKGRGKKSSRA